MLSAVSDPDVVAIAFVDLAGYSALTEAHGDAEAVEFVGRFEALAHTALGAGDHLVKTIGDAVMVAAPDPLAAAEFVGRLCRATDSEPPFPIVRAGIHAGPVVRRDNDYYGTTVNIAARVAAMASGGEVLVTGAVAAATTPAGIPTESIGTHSLRHISEPIELYRIEVCSAPHARLIDPVCHMALDQHDAAGRLRHEGRDYWFCSLACVDNFARHPERYALVDDT